MQAKDETFADRQSPNRLFAHVSLNELLKFAFTFTCKLWWVDCSLVFFRIPTGELWVGVVFVERRASVDVVGKRLFLVRVVHFVVQVLFLHLNERLHPRQIDACKCEGILLERRGHVLIFNVRLVLEALADVTVDVDALVKL